MIDLNIRFVYIIICLMAISACSTSVKRPNTTSTSSDGMLIPDLETKKQEPIIIKPTKKTEFISKPVVRNLLTKAKLRSEAMDYDSAIHLLERGIAISPNDPILWQNMAEVRLKQGDLAQAKQLAMKSNALVEADEELRAINLQIIEEVRRREKIQKLGGSVLH